MGCESGHLEADRSAEEVFPDFQDPADANRAAHAHPLCSVPTDGPDGWRGAGAQRRGSDQVSGIYEGIPTRARTSLGLRSIRRPCSATKARRR